NLSPDAAGLDADGRRAGAVAGPSGGRGLECLHRAARGRLRRHDDLGTRRAARRAAAGGDGSCLSRRGDGGAVDLRLLRARRGDVGGISMFLWALALLGPSCYAPTIGVRLLSDAIPGARRWLLGLLFAALAWPLAATGFALRLELVFGLIGALVAPMVGAMAA